MRLVNPGNYRNVLPHISLTSKDIVSQIQRHRLTFINYRNDTVEWKMRIPMFARPFYEFVYRTDRIPTQEELFGVYVMKNKGYFDGNMLNDDILRGIKARCFRSQPSLVRDLCFNKLVSERLTNYNVMYSLELDIQDGIDLLIYDSSSMYGVNLYTDTKRAYDGRRHKTNRHEKFDNVKYIEFPVTFTERNKVGDYFLYGEEEYNNLTKLIKS